MNRLIIAGGRDFDPATESGETWLDALVERYGKPVAVLSGGAPGSDAFGERWAGLRGIKLEPYSPWDPQYRYTWKKHGRRAGPLRNRHMARNADALALFPGGDGSADMRRAAHAAGLAVYVYPELFAERAVAGEGR